MDVLHNYIFVKVEEGGDDLLSSRNIEERVVSDLATGKAMYEGAVLSFVERKVIQVIRPNIIVARRVGPCHGCETTSATRTTRRRRKHQSPADSAEQSA